MKRNSCYLKVIGMKEQCQKYDARRGYPDWREPGRFTHCSSRPDHTETRPIKDWVRMHYQPMKAVRDHLLLGCPCCQPGVIMRMFLERARKIGRVNADVLNLARWVAKGRPTRLTRQVYKEMLALKAVQEVHTS